MWDDCTYRMVEQLKIEAFENGVIGNFKICLHTNHCIFCLLGHATPLRSWPGRPRKGFVVCFVLSVRLTVQGLWRKRFNALCFSNYSWFYSLYFRAYWLFSRTTWLAYIMVMSHGARTSPEMSQVLSLVEDFQANLYSSSSSETSPSVSNAAFWRPLFSSQLVEGLYLLPSYRCCYIGPVEVRKVVCHVVDCAVHHLWPEPLFCELRVDRCWLSRPTPSCLPRSSSVRVAPVHLVHRALFLVRASFVLAVARSTSSGFRLSCQVQAASNSSRKISAQSLHPFIDDITP